MKTWPFIEAFCHNPLPEAPYADRVGRLRRAFDGADRVVIGAGAGLSAAAGLTYGGRRFAEHFADYRARYGLTDMYSSAFFPFPTEEERWAYWARHVLLNRYDTPTNGLYRELLELVRAKDYFVITTNVDGQFEQAGFDASRLFAVQGDYAYLQCATGCHDRLYPDKDLMRRMVRHTRDLRIPAALVPRGPVCGGRMEVHVRKDAYFVENEAWHAAYRRYRDFMERARAGRTLLLELGVGYNTPFIIRFPFERMAAQRPGMTLARLNRDHPEKQAATPRFIPFTEDLRRVLRDLRKPE